MSTRWWPQEDYQPQRNFHLLGGKDLRLRDGPLLRILQRLQLQQPRTVPLRAGVTVPRFRCVTFVAAYRPHRYTNMCSAAIGEDRYVCLHCLCCGWISVWVLAHCRARFRRRAAGKSAFDLGDGNPGMANIDASWAHRAALACLAGDILKTLVPVLIMSRVFPQLDGQPQRPLTGLGATLGFIFPFWHGFRGGKGVATIASTIILINPFWGILTAVIGAVSIVVTGYLSAAAVVGMVFYTIASMFFGAPEPAIVSLIFLALTVYAHWSKLRARSLTALRNALVLPRSFAAASQTQKPRMDGSPHARSPQAFAQFSVGSA